MADQTLSVTAHNVHPRQNGGAWVQASIYMGKDKQSGNYNDSHWVKMLFPHDMPQPKQRITVSCNGMGWDEYTNPTTGEARKTPLFYVESWHPKAQHNQGYGAQQHPPSSSYQNQELPF